MNHGWLRRMWSRERQGWARPRTWKFYAVMTLLLGLQGVLAVGRGDRWLALPFGTIAAASALLAVLAYKEAHRG